jgi:hypothetical protein
VRARPTLSLVATCAVALLAGCSDGDEPSATSTEASTTATTTKEHPPDFATTADSLCSEAMAEQEALRRELGGRQITLGDRARLLVELAPVRIALAEDLAQLDPPEGDGKDLEKLVASAKRRGEASALAGELWEKDAPKDDIAEQAAIEHDERELFVEIARDLDLGACAEVLAHIEEEAAASTALGLFTERPARRCDLLGERFLSEQFGSRKNCLDDELLLTLPNTGLAVEELDGMDQVFALARVSTPNGEFRVRLTYEDGAYRVDKID